MKLRISCLALFTRLDCEGKAGLIQSKISKYYFTFGTFGVFFFFFNLVLSNFQCVILQMLHLTAFSLGTVACKLCFSKIVNIKVSSFFSHAEPESE